MSFVSQILHVFRKDVVRARWLLLAYVAGVVLVVMMSSGVIIPPANALQVGPVIVWAIGLFVFAMSVQDDSPSRIDSYWVSTSQRASAVLVAKLLLALTLVVVPAMLGEWLALQLLGIDAGLAWRLIARPLAAFAALLACAYLLAARVRDVRTLVGAALLVPVALVVTDVAISRFMPFPMRVRLPATLSWSLLASTVLVAVTIGCMYRVRDAGKVVWVGIVGSIFALAFTVAHLQFMPRKQPVRITGTPTTRVRLLLGDVRSDLALHEIGVDAYSEGLAGNERLEVNLTSVEMAGATRRGESMPAHSMQFTIGSDRPVLPERVRWLAGEVDDDDDEAGRARFHIRPSHYPAIRQGVASIVAAGVVVEVEALERFRIPVVGGRSAAHSGVRLTVTEAALNDSTWVSISLVTAETGERFSTLFSRRHSFTLVNRKAGEAIQLAAYGTPFERFESRARTILAVLPTVTRTRSRVTTLPRPALSAEVGARITSAWLQDAELVIHQWVPRATYPVSLQEILPAFDMQERRTVPNVPVRSLPSATRSR
ncbi:MAG: hypothetical protein V4617_00665 [Gemmatimonadota bacterium]